jgi:YD repeat-containing protein
LTTTPPIRKKQRRTQPCGKSGLGAIDTPQKTDCLEFLMQLTKVQQGGTTVASYTYDANGNRATMVTSAGTTTYTYDSADVMLVSKKDPTNKVTNYTYDSNGNLTKAVYDPTGANQTTTYKYDANNRLIEVDEPSGTVVKFMYDADGNRISKAVTSGGTTATINDVYSLGHLAEQTDNSGNILATFTYDMKGEPTSVIVGNPTSGTRYYYVYNGHGDVVALVDTSGTVQASYSYDAFGNLTSSSETLANGWSNPYRFDGGGVGAR